MSYNQSNTELRSNSIVFCPPLISQSKKKPVLFKKKITWLKSSKVPMLSTVSTQQFLPKHSHLFLLQNLSYILNAVLFQEVCSNLRADNIVFALFSGVGVSTLGCSHAEGNPHLPVSQSSVHLPLRFLTFSCVSFPLVEVGSLQPHWICEIKLRKSCCSLDYF